MANEHYWTESLKELCEECGFAPDKNFIDGVIGIAENESLACGYDCIRSPSESEVNILKKQIEDLKHKHDLTLNEIANNYADANGWDRRLVKIEDNKLKFEKLWLN